MTRPITPLVLPGAARQVPPGLPPAFRQVAPTDLRVDEAYQRGLSDGSMRLIGRIVAGWDWARFKPPVVAEGADGLEVIDGQHTAIAAATLGLATIPVMVVDAPDVARKAAAFVGHNRTRLALTAAQVHRAGVLAGHECDLDVAKACRLAGVTVRATPPAQGRWAPGETTGATRRM